MSPRAPGRTAYTGRIESAGWPELMYRSSSAATGVAAWIEVIPASSQSWLPFVSYERTFLLDVVTISVRSLFCQTNGVDQFDLSSRGTRHSSLPVRASYAARKDFASVSLTI